MLTRWDLNELRHEDDELMHYGVKGMRWGKHLPGVDILNAAVAKARAAGAKGINSIAENAEGLYKKGVKSVNKEAKDFSGSDIYKTGSKLLKEGEKAANNLYKKSASLQGLSKDSNRLSKMVKSYSNKKFSEIKKSVNSGASKASSLIKKYTGIKISKSGIDSGGVLSKARNLERKFNNSKAGKYLQLRLTRHL